MTEIAEWIPQHAQEWFLNQSGTGFPATVARHKRLVSDTRLRPLYGRLAGVPLDHEGWWQILYAADDAAYLVGIWKRTAAARKQLSETLGAAAKAAAELAQHLERLPAIAVDADAWLPLEIQFLPGLVCEAGRDSAMFQTLLREKFETFNPLEAKSIPTNAGVIGCLARIARALAERGYETGSPDLGAVLASRKYAVVAGFVRAFDRRFNYALRFSPQMTNARPTAAEVGALAAVALGLPSSVRKFTDEDVTDAYKAAVINARRKPRREGGVGHSKPQMPANVPLPQATVEGLESLAWLYGKIPKEAK